MCSKRSSFKLQLFICLQLRKKIQEKAKDGTLVVTSSNSSNGDGHNKTEVRKRGRWDQTVNQATEVPAKKAALLPMAPSWEAADVRVIHLCLSSL